MLRGCSRTLKNPNSPPLRIRVTQYESGPRRTYQVPAGRIRAPCDEPGPFKTKQVPHAAYDIFKRYFLSLQLNLGPSQKIVGQIREVFSFGVPY